MSKGVEMLCLQAPYHVSSVLDLFISRPETSWKARNVSNRFWAGNASETKAEVSSAYCDNIFFVVNFYFSNIFVFPTAFARISVQRAKRIPDRGQPCLTPLCKLKNSEKRSLLMTQLVTSASNVLIQFAVQN